MGFLTSLGNRLMVLIDLSYLQTAGERWLLSKHPPPTDKKRNQWPHLFSNADAAGAAVGLLDAKGF